MSSPTGYPEYRPTPEEEAELARLLAERFAGLDPRFRTPNQLMGRRATVGCVALEITQRCNLDCTLCYLSEHSESVPDPPVEELKHKLDNIKRLFGVGTSVEITGGDPTLRQRDELVEIVRYGASIGLRPALFTNGIRASRTMLEELREVGLVGIVFHVDTTQERKGFASERELDEIRERYLERTRGLGLAVTFNTTVHDGNFDDVPELVRWLVRHAGEVGTASFQLQADTGRGYVRRRGRELTRQAMRRRIEVGCGTRLSWDAVRMGHPECHDLAYTLCAGETVVDLLDRPEIVERLLADFAAVPLDRQHPIDGARRVAWHVLARRPQWLRLGAPWLARIAARLAPALVLSRGRVGRLDFFMQNFQDADALDPERIAHCSYYVATREGAVSMCAHNARRDEYIIPAHLVRGVDVTPKRPPIAEVLRPHAGQVGRRGSDGE